MFFTVRMMEFSLRRPAKRHFIYSIAAVPVKTEKIIGKSFDDLSPEEKKIRKQFWMSLKKKMLTKKQIRALLNDE